jgi:hypothetical protein
MGALCYLKSPHKNGFISHDASGVGIFAGLASASLEPEEEVVCVVEKGCIIRARFITPPSTALRAAHWGWFILPLKLRLQDVYTVSMEAQQADIGV